MATSSDQQSYSSAAYADYTAYATAATAMQLNENADCTRWEKAQMQCTWCRKVGNYYYNYENLDDSQEYYNWRVTTTKEPGTIICNACYRRERPPHVDYLRELDKLEKKCFSMLGELLNNIAEFAYGEYARFSPERIKENQSSKFTNDEFPVGQKVGRREKRRRE